MPFELKPQAVEIKKAREASKLDIFMYKYSFLVLMVLLGLFLAGCFFFLLKPKYEEILVSYSQEYEAKKSEAEILKINERNLTQYLLDYNNISNEEKDIINKMIPEENQYELIYAEMDRLVSGRGLILKKVSVNLLKEEPKGKKTEDSSPDLGKFEVDITVDGVNYKGFKELLSAIEKNIKLMDIKSVNFSPNSFTANISFITYYSKL